MADPHGTSIDLVREYVKLKQSYFAKGYQKGKATQASPGMLVNDVYPILLRKDVALLSAAFIRWIYADYFVQTTSYKNALNGWLSSFEGMGALSSDLREATSAFVPGAVGGAITVALANEKTAAYVQKLYANGVANLSYPYSEGFWGTLKILVIARGGAGMVLTPFEIAIESLGEALGDLRNQLPCISFSCLIPAWALWGTVAVGGLWLYSKFGKKD